MAEDTARSVANDDNASTKQQPQKSSGLMASRQAQLAQLLEKNQPQPSDFGGGGAAPAGISAARAAAEKIAGQMRGGLGGGDVAGGIGDLVVQGVARRRPTPTQPVFSEDSLKELNHRLSRLHEFMYGTEQNAQDIVVTPEQRTSSPTLPIVHRLLSSSASALANVDSAAIKAELQEANRFIDPSWAWQVLDTVMQGQTLSERVAKVAKIVRRLLKGPLAMLESILKSAHVPLLAEEGPTGLVVALSNATAQRACVIEAQPVILNVAMNCRRIEELKPVLEWKIDAPGCFTNNTETQHSRPVDRKNIQSRVDKIEEDSLRLCREVAELDDELMQLALRYSKTTATINALAVELQANGMLNTTTASA